MNKPLTVGPFHRGELAVQTRFDVREQADYIGQNVFHDHLPAEDGVFLAQLPFVLIGAIDSEDHPWASILMGRPGFITSPDSHMLEINAERVFGDPLTSGLSPGTQVGLLGIEYHSRRRYRITGKISKIKDQSISIGIGYAYFNCPQYIQSRNYELLPAIDTVGEARATRQIGNLDSQARQLITAADHFYIATHFSENAEDNSHGADVSHRGGKPGFVCVEDDHRLTFPDFLGNNLFNTVGNILVNPRAGLLFIDFKRGDLLYLTGEAEVIWDGDEKRAFVGAERLVRFTLGSGVLIENAVPIRWQFEDYSPSLAHTGSWEEVSDKLRIVKEGNQYRNYRVMRVVQESKTISSFYLEPETGDMIPCHIAGQFLPIQIQPPSSEEPIGRTYTISNAPNGSYYRLSIKREPAASPDLPAGLSSNYFHDHVVSGSIIRALMPRGKFMLDESSTRPVVLISGGVGITPMISMLEALVADSTGCGRTRPVWFIHGAIDGKVHAFGDHVRKNSESYACLNTHIRYSKPSADDVIDYHYDSTGYIDIDLLKTLLPWDDYDFYLCGPPPFMESLYNGLKTLNVGEERIHYEFFGPGATLNEQPEKDSRIEQLGDQKPVAVHFERSGIQTTWDPSKGTLLDLAESAGLSPAYSCRSGICQTCATKISQGDVAYLEPPMVAPADGSALICSCYPQSKATEAGELLPLILDL